MEENQVPERDHKRDCGEETQKLEEHATADGSQIAVRYDGAVGLCHAFANSGEYFKGNILHKDFETDENDLETWASRSPLNMPECKECFGINLCGGGCAYNAKLTYGKLNYVDKNICIHTKMLLDWVMEEIWKTKLNS
ncbi:MAG: SPASM domain-containing protein [Nanoarchaeota archaeon]|nr:SPASM domain-containing protein [Nanoarchaeota archaeon]